MAPNKKQQAIIDELDRRINMCREFAGEWVRFNQILSAFRTPGIDKVQLEKEFLKVKSRIARAFSVLRETLQSDFKIEPTLMNIIYNATDLDSVHAQSEVAIKKLQGEWNRALMSIEETLGLLENKKVRAEAGEKIFLMTAGGVQSTKGGGGGGGGGMSEKTKKNIMIIAVIIGIVAAMYFIPPIREMYKDAFIKFGILKP